jgi:glycosyltransferase involved in cell wall biosynthesis
MLSEKSVQPPAVLLLPWGLLIEDFLDRDGLSLETFATEFTGSWMFGCAAALRTAGVRTVIVCISGRVEKRVEYVHRPTGATVVALPAPRLYRLLRRAPVNPYQRLRQVTRKARWRSPRGLARVAVAVVNEVAPYLSTPLVALAREIRRHDVAAVLCQEYEFPRFDLCVGLGGLVRVPTFAIFQGGDYQRWKLERWLRPRAVRRSAGLIIAPRSEALRVADAYGTFGERVAAIPNPVDTDIWRPGDRGRARHELGISPLVDVVAWHGRLDIWKKGLDVLLDAWDVLSRLPGERVLLLVGGGRDADELRARLDASRFDNVRWVDELVTSPSRIRDQLAAADVYVFPSRAEGFPVALVEAIACGLPAVAADASGVLEILGPEETRAGIIVPREDAQALAAAVEHLLEDVDERGELADRARRRAVERFSLAAVGSDLRRFLLADAGSADMVDQSARGSPRSSASA